jgi:acetylornithine deacetylase
VTIPLIKLEEVWRHIRPERLFELLEDSVGEYSPSFAEGPALRVFGAALDEAGLPSRRQTVDGDRVNLVVELGPQPPALLWVGHLDTVPLMADDALRCVREAGVLHGLGAADMKSGCAAAVEALAALRESGVKLERGLCVGLVVGEEETGDGARVLAREVAAPLTVIGEPTSLAPCVEHYGYLELRLVARGRRAHAAVPEAGASAIHAMLTWITRLIDGAAAHPNADGMAVSVRDIRGGSKMFVVADSCEAVLNVHLRPDLAPEVVELLAHETAGDDDGIELTQERLHWDAGYPEPSGEAQRQRLAPLERAFGAIGRPWAPIAFRSHSDASIFGRRSTPPVICGPGALEVAHSRHEHVVLDEVLDAARLYAALFYEACVA